ncbi:MAG: response regulator transcription factor [Planctomycetaceae bacterium]|nr:response regulator transcription factor [Planctomycetaceae bacterium]
MLTDIRQDRSDTECKRVFIVDDHPAVRDGIKSWLARSTEFAFCGEAADISEAEFLLPDSGADILVVDIALPSGNGLDLVKRFRTEYPQCVVFVWSMYDKQLYADRARRAGALGYISKRDSIDSFVETIRTAVRPTPPPPRPVLRKYRPRRAGSVESLSDRELEVFLSIGEGSNVQQIAERLNLSVKTVETYRARIKQKLDLATHNDLIRVAVQWLLETR